MLNALPKPGKQTVGMHLTPMHNAKFPKLSYYSLVSQDHRSIPESLSRPGQGCTKDQQLPIQQVSLLYATDIVQG